MALLKGADREPHHMLDFRDFVTEQCAKLAEQILAHYSSALSSIRDPGAAPGGAGQDAGAGLPSAAAATAVLPPEPAPARLQPGAALSTGQEVLAGELVREQVLVRSILSPNETVTPRLVSPTGDHPPTTFDMPSEDSMKTNPTISVSSNARLRSQHSTEDRRIVMFMDMSPECDDECAFLFILSDLNQKQIRARIDLVMADSEVRYRWMQHLFRDKFTGKGEWRLRPGGYGFQVDGVTVEFYVLHSPKREQVALKDIAEKVPSLDLAGPCDLHALEHELVPGGFVDVVLVAAPIPDLDPGFFNRFETVGMTFVVGTPGGINCQQPSWSSLLSSLHRVGPLIYLAPQFTRMVRFPRAYVRENPHWTAYMKKTVFDMALTCMARRPEIPVSFGDWGLILRLNAANAKLCDAWFGDVMCKGLGDAESCPAYIRSIVQAYVDRNSGDDRRVGGVVNELQLLGVSTAAAVDSCGQPSSEEAAVMIREAYRRELFRHVYTCVATTETVIFQNEANFKPNTGAGHFRTLYPRCGYSDPQRSLSTIYGVEDAIAILQDLPIKNLTPAYDMVGAIFAVQFLERGDFEDLGVEIEAASASIGAGLVTDGAASCNDILVVGEQTQEVVEGVVGMLSWEVEHDPLLILDGFWVDWRDSIGKVGGTCSDGQVLDEGGGSRFSIVMAPHATERPSKKASLAERLQCLVIHPASIWNFPWAALSLVCIMYDFVTIPLLVFAIDQDIIAMWTTFAFWTVDIARSFFVGYYRNGGVEVRLAMTASNYFKTWFIMDSFVTSFDFVYLYLQQSILANPNSRVVMYMRLLRSVRSIRFLKMVQLPAAGDSFAETLRIPLVACAFKIFQMMFFIFATMHLAACGWYFIASPLNPGRDDVTWITTAHLDGDNASVPVLYWTSMHWALAHLLLGEIDVISTNVSERLYAIAMFLLGLVVFSSFVSSLTEFMTETAAKSTEKKKQDEAVQRYLDRNSVSVSLANQIHIFRRHTRHISQRSVPRQEIDGLCNIPESLAMRLSAEVYCPRLKEHSFFLVHSVQHEEQLNEAVSALITEQAHLPKEDVFLPGQDAANVLIVMEGDLEYIRSLNGHENRPVGAGQWVSEPALWLTWKRHGQLQSLSGCCLMNLSVRAFREWVTAEIHCGLFAAKFAELQARSLLNLDVPLLQLSDLHMDKEALQEVATRAAQLTGYAV